MAMAKVPNITFKNGVNFNHGLDGRAFYDSKVVGWDVVQKYHTMHDADYMLTNNEVTAIQNEIEHVLRWAIKSDQFIPLKISVRVYIRGNISRGLILHRLDGQEILD